MTGGPFTNSDAGATRWIAIAAASGTISAAVSVYAPRVLDPFLGVDPFNRLMTGSFCGALHALAILAVAMLAGSGQADRRFASMAQWLFTIGIVLFPGALYGLALHGPHWLQAIEAAGAMALILGWATAITAAIANRAYLRSR
jgi:uncharacterized membrane protein YgdD (TMEM256/DUF423 family)